MNELTIAITILTAVVQVLAVLRKTWEEVRNWGNFVAWLIVILFTLFFPQGFVLYIALPYIIQAVSESTWEQNPLKWGIALSASAIGSIVPFLWAIYLLPFITHYFRSKR
ncbi:hypothetical protein FGF66_10660 [Chlorobaculum thiosulfatiphilum]|jgi:hypothetical protein|uniref:Uncharacterized protein n=1 Tax=Chlorobaculum thiosulfatiphilum TaxID=115852 RepID=A0A5C4S1V0_CHLTI|nr:hypothetical protein [Chlorobaculum thiosulfatiphilum]TNJ37493.1 hypothetical protein FGF66_10660 [Chlorobaculum thiosulfatiphilum]